jgi:hypothetical protein
MKRLMTAWAFVFLISSLIPRPSLLFAANSNVGTSGAAFLKIGPGARPAAMGEAYTGVADDIDAIYWNPAGLATIKSPEIEGMHMQYFQSILYEYAAFAYPTTSYGTWGMAVTNLYTNDLQARTQDTDAPAGTFSSNDSAYWLSYAYPLTSKLSLGANMKYIRQTLDDTASTAYAADGGVLYDTGWRQLRLGASVQNVGSQVKFANESDPLPLTARFGASAPVLNDHLLLSSDVIVPRDNSAAVAFGGEYKGRLVDGLRYAIRSGYQTGGTVDGLNGVSAGGGLTYGRVSLDFAWVPFGELGNTYRYAIHVKFGESSDNKNLTDNTHDSLKQANASPGADAELQQLLSL